MPPFDLDADDAVHTWTYQGLGPLPRLYEDAYRIGYEAQLRCYRQTGVPFIAAAIVRFVDGYVYAREAPSDGIAEVRERFLATTRPLLDRGTTYYDTHVRDRVIAGNERLRRHPPLRAPAGDHARHLRNCIDHYALVMGDLHWRMAGSHDLDWPTLFAELTGEPKPDAGLLTRGLVTEETRLIRRLRTLARIAQGDAELADALRRGDIEGARSHTRFWSAFRRMMRRWGLRNGSGWGSKTDDMAPTWNMRPGIPLGMIARYLDADLDAIDARERRIREQRRRDERRFRRLVGREHLARFDRGLRFAQRVAHMMEEHNFLMDQCSAGLLREAADQMGRKLVRMGLVDDPEDALHLSLDELDERPDDLRVRVAERRREHAHRRGLEPPETVGAAPSTPKQRWHDEGEGLVDGVLRGLAASSGRYTGPARVVTEPDFSAFEPGDVLVTTDTGPDWTPLFPLLGAVVLDKGTTWQHAAVVAREFGIPAVVGTKEATTAIADGQTLVVDGDTGTVELG